MTTAYTVAGKFVTLKELTCPNGHSNRAIDFDNLGTSELLPCEFKHLGATWEFCKRAKDGKSERHPNSGFEKELLNRYGYDNPVAALAICNVCNSVFFFASITEDDKRNCQCIECELKRIKYKKAALTEEIYFVYPVTAKRLALGLPESGTLNEIQKKQMDNYVPPKRGARYISKTFARLAETPEIDEIPF